MTENLADMHGDNISSVKMTTCAIVSGSYSHIQIKRSEIMHSANMLHSTNTY
jgi:hypothetical protein